MKKSVIIAFVIAVLNFVNANVFAQELYSKYDFLSDTVTIKGSFDNKKEMVLFMVLPSQENIADITEQIIADNKYLTYQIRNKSDGSFETVFQMPIGSLSGEYKVYAFSNGDRLETEFVYISEQELENAVNDINTSGSSGISEILKEKSDILGISSECVNYSDMIAVMIADNKPSGGYDAEGFMEELNRSSAIALLKHSGDVDEVMWFYGKSFGDKAQTEIENMTNNQKNTFADYVAENEVGKDTTQFFYQAVLMSNVLNANRYADLKGIIDTYKKSAGLDVNTDKLSVNEYKTLFNKGITTFSEFESTIKYLSDNKVNQNAGLGGVGGAGGGGGGGGGGASVPSVSSGNENVVQKNEGLYTSKYSDIKGHWCEESIKSFINAGFVSGYTDGTFKPDKTVTRAEFVKLLVSALNINVENIAQFDDVKESDWYFGYIGAGVKNGLVTGYANNFCPDDMIKRQDAAVIICRALNINTDENASLNYADAGEIANYASGAISALSELKLLGGDGVNFLPQKSTTRAEAVVMIDRMLKFAKSGEVK